MIKKLRIIFIAAFIMLWTVSLKSQSGKITWHSFEEAVKLNATNPKMVFVDIYTDWCGWCKQLDKTTFIDPGVVKQMNKNFYAVKLNAERKDTVVFNGHTFVNPNPAGFRSAHQLAASMLKGRLSYPSMVFMNDSMNIITSMAGFLKATDLEPILVYIGEKKYRTMTYDSFKLTYTPEPVIATTPAAAKAVIMNKVAFDAGQSVIKAGAYTQLDSVVAALKANTGLKIEINGYTDNTGDATANKSLSEKRAKAVYDYFTAKGIDAARMAYAGYGDLNPIADNSTAAGQALNRRIEIKTQTAYSRE